jgi:hypothetical protein
VDAYEQEVHVYGQEKHEEGNHGLQQRYPQQQQQQWVEKEEERQEP